MPGLGGSELLNPRKNPGFSCRRGELGLVSNGGPTIGSTDLFDCISRLFALFLFLLDVQSVCSSYAEMERRHAIQYV